MIGYLKHINPKTKILFFVLILIMVPCSVLSYLGLQSIDQNTENLRTKYGGTINLVRDKLESKIIQIEENLRNNIVESFHKFDNDAELKEWIHNIESDNPAFKHLFLINSGGGLFSSSVSLGWNNMQRSRPLLNSQAAANFNLAEKTELIRKDYVDAIGLYQRALVYATSPQGRALLLSRIGRCYFKTGKYEEGILEYRKILKLGNEEITLGAVPASIAALSQIADGYEVLKEKGEQYNAITELYQRLINNPWDLIGGEYLYYLKSAGEKIRSFETSGYNINSTEKRIGELINQENKLLEQIRFIEFIYQNVLTEIESDLKNGTSYELQPRHISRIENNSTLQLGYFKLPSALQKSQLIALGFQIDKDYILSDLFPEVLTSVELGNDVFVGILGEMDNLLYPQDNRQISNYLVAENFSQLFVNWKVALFDRDGRTIEQLVGRERQLYLALFIGIIAVMLIGIFVTIRAVIHELEISRMKSEFVSNVSHELKTPLALIRLFGETLDSGIVKDERKRREFYSIIRKESERLTHLIDNVLDFSRMDTGVKEYNFEKADLVEVVRSSLEAYKFHIRDNGFEIESSLPNESVMLKIDKDAISQALLNLLSNAVKYSEETKYILVKVSKDSTSALISVTDRGIGIAKEELKKIFDKFYQVPAAKGKERRGSGLGLTLAKHIIEAHGGIIEVESEVGKGSSFTIRIPLFGI
jgi:signal transduction histidine kinase